MFRADRDVPGRKAGNVPFLKHRDGNRRAFAPDENFSCSQNLWITLLKKY